MTDPSRVLGVRRQQEQNIVKEEVSGENSTDQQNYPHNRKNLALPGPLFAAELTSQPR